MITIEELFAKANQGEKTFKKDKIEKLQEQNQEEFKALKADSWKPYEIKNFNLPEFKITVKNSNRSSKATGEKLSKILTFIDSVKRKRLKTGCTALPIPTTSRKNLKIWGNPKEISRAIKYMIEIGLISVYDETFRFGTKYKNGNFGKTYAYYVDNEKKFIQYCNDNNIQKYVVESILEELTEEQEKTMESIDETVLFEIAEVKFSNNLKLKMPEYISKKDFEIFLTLCLYQNYPEFKFTQIKVKEINEHYKEYPEFAMVFEPHFTWDNNVVTKIGIRATNEFCNKKKEDRAEILDEYELNLQKDIKSSVPRITLAINTGKWPDESIDIYERINEEFEPGSAFTNNRREAIKHYHLVSYFAEGSDKLLGKNVTYKLIDREGINKPEVDELMGRLRKAALKVEGGKFYGSEIFYVESCVYLMTVYDLLCSGYKVWLVYDAFYARGREDQKTFNEMIENMVELNFRFFMQHSKINPNYKEWTVEDENIKKITVAEIIEKYKKLGCI